MAPALLRRSFPRVAPPASTVARLRIALGTTLAIEATAQSEERARGAIEAGFAAAADIETRMHPHRSGSEVARLNGAAPGTRVPVHASTWELLMLSRRLNALSEGLFDPCSPSKPARLGDLEIGSGPGETHWLIAHAPVELDLGGIAKGFAVDRAVDALAAGGCSAGLVNAGGDLRVFGPQRAPIRLRRSDGPLEALALKDAALAVSELEGTHRPPEHLGYYSRTGSMTVRCRFAAVLAPKAALADALTKCVLLAPAEILERIVQALGPGVVILHPAAAT